MKFGSTSREPLELDSIDCSILELLQENCKQPLAQIGEKVGLKAPSVQDRIHKLEEAGLIRGYVALLDGRLLGKDVTAFIGVSTEHPRAISALEAKIAAIGDVLECHHVTGSWSLLVKAKTRNTESLEDLIEEIRSIDGVTRTETLVALSTATERARIALTVDEDDQPQAENSDAISIRRALSARVRRKER
jgi:Lrp/AsnC family leucine-responsive transcriptional regulator